jgi:hypothetical protein
MTKLNNDAYDRPEQEQVNLDGVMKVIDSSSVTIAANFRLANGQKTIGVIVLPKQFLTVGQASNHAVLFISKGFFESEADFFTRCEELGISREELIERPGQSKMKK